jgi:hypothetical protein
VAEPEDAVRTSLPVLPARRDGKRGQTVSVGPVGALVMVLLWYPVVLVAELVVVIFYALGWLAVHGAKAVASLCRWPR